MPRAGRWLEEAGGSRGNGSNDVQDLSMMGHVVVGQVTLSQRMRLKFRAVAFTVDNPSAGSLLISKVDFVLARVQRGSGVVL